MADQLMERVDGLCRREFCVGNIAPDCNVENEDWTSFTPPREVTHWMGGPRKEPGDCERFYREYVEKRREEAVTLQECSFLLGYYVHLLADGLFQQMVWDSERVRAAWSRLCACPELSRQAAGMPETWDSVKLLLPKGEREKGIAALEREYLDGNPGSGYFTEIMALRSFLDYISYLPKGAIARKGKVMGRLPEKAAGEYPYIGISREEYTGFVEQAAEWAAAALREKLAGAFQINRKNAGSSGPVFVLFAVFAFTGLVFVLGNGYNRGEKIPGYVHISVYTGLPGRFQLSSTLPGTGAKSSCSAHAQLVGTHPGTKEEPCSISTQSCGLWWA